MSERKTVHVSATKKSSLLVPRYGLVYFITFKTLGLVPFSMESPQETVAFKMPSLNPHALSIRRSHAVRWFGINIMHVSDQLCSPLQRTVEL